MNKYIAIMLFKASSDDPEHKALYQENIVEVTAQNETSASKAIKELATLRETSYLNDEGHKITWSLKQIVDMTEVLECEAENSVRELYARHFTDFESYKKVDSLVND